MGSEFRAKCKKCGFKFNVKDGGGFFFHLLRCDTCGKTKSICFDEIGEPHLKYIKGMPGAYCVASQNLDRDIQENYKGEPITEEEYHSIVEDMVGKCKCGGQYKFEAPIRCPKCRSTEYEDTGELHIMYD